MPVYVGVAHFDENGEARKTEHAPVVDPHADSGERTYASFNHYIGLLSLVDQTALGLIGSIVMWAVKHKESPFLDDHGREAINFQLSLLLYLIVGTVVSFGGLTVVLVPAFFIIRLIFCIKAGLAATRGEFYRYPITIRFLG
ncbi:MAG: DUF4870 domain-containing protein [Phycisphaerales bacterium]